MVKATRHLIAAALMIAVAIVLMSSIFSGDDSSAAESGDEFTITLNGVEIRYEIALPEVGPAYVTILDAIDTDDESTPYSLEIPESVTYDETDYVVKIVGNWAFDGLSDMTSITFPDTIESIGTYVFEDCTSLGSFTIPDGIDIVSYSMFYGCSSLESISIPDSVTSIDEYAFCGCSSLESIAIPSSVVAIGYCAFYECSSIESIELPAALLTLGDSAFAHCGSLTSITIPEGVGVIGNSLFHMCISLESVDLNERIEIIEDSAFRDCSSLTSITMPSSVEYIGDNAFYGCESLTSITIPESTTSIGESIFEGCYGLTEVIIDGSIDSIPAGAFNDCNSLESIALPYSVQYIGNSAFRYCSSLSSVSIPDSVTHIGDYAFRDCSSLSSVSIPDSVTHIGDYAFRDCSSMVTATMTGGVTSIGTSAFEGCTRLESIYIPSSTTSIGYFAFCECSSLEEVTIAGEITEIIDSTFRRCSSLSSITLPSTVISIGDSAFYECSSLSSISIPSSTTSIGDFAFCECYGLETASLGANVETIGSNAFDGCEMLSDIAIPASVESIGNQAFYGCMGLTAFTVDEANLHYKSIDGVLFTEDGTELIQFPALKEGPYVIPNDVESVCIDAFSQCTGLTSVIIPDSVTYLGSGAFYGCTSLSSVTLNASINAIEEDTFCYCESLESISIPDSVMSIGEYAFYDCLSITTISIGTGLGDGLGFIGNYAFNGCNALTEFVVAEGNANYKSIDGVLLTEDGTELIRFPAAKGGAYTVPDSVLYIWDDAFVRSSSLTSVDLGNVEEIGVSAFESCEALESVTFCESLQHIGTYAFSGCIALKDVTIIGTNLIIDEHAFENCTGLENATFSDGVDSIGVSAFEWCTSLESVTLGANITSIEDYTFYNCTSLASISIPEGVTIIGCDAFFSCDNLATVSIPDSMEVISVNAFNGCKSLASIDLDGTAIESIGDYAFYNCTSLASITLPDTLTSLGASAFSQCFELESIVMPHGIESIRENAFDECSALESVTIPDSVTAIDSYAFHDCTSLASIVIPGTVEFIGEYAFHGCTSLVSIRIPDAVTYIGEFALSECDSLTEIVVEEGNTEYASVDGILFSHDMATLIQFPGGKTGAYAVPESVTSFSDSAFSGCAGLTSLTIPASVDCIGGALYGCSAMTEIVVAEGNADYKSIDGVLFNKAGTELILFPGGKTGAYTVPDGVKSIQEYAFEGCTLLTSLRISDSVAYIGYGAFIYCTGLTSVYIGTGLTYYGEAPFVGCTALTAITVADGNEDYKSIDGVLFDKSAETLIQFPMGRGGAYTVPDSVTSIYEYAFKGCEELIEIDLSNATMIGSSAFEDCVKLERAIMPDVTEIGYYAFGYCYELVEVVMSDSDTRIGDNAFTLCERLSIIDLSNVTTIGYCAFVECASLTHADLAKIKYIDHYAFSYCTDLKYISFGDSLVGIEEDSFGHPLYAYYSNIPGSSFLYDEEMLGYNPGHKVSFHSSESAKPMGFTVVPDGGKVARPSDPILYGHVFYDWYANPSFESLWDFNNSVITGDLAVYALFRGDVAFSDVSVAEGEYDGSELDPSITASFDESDLVEGVDYTWSLIDIDGAVDAGTYRILIEGIGGWTGGKEVTWVVNPRQIAEGDVSVGGLTYNGSSQDTPIEVLGGILEEGTDYQITGARSGTDAGGYGFTVTIISECNYAGSVDVNWSISKKNIIPDMISIGELTYTGSLQNASVTVDGGTARLTDDYTVTETSSGTDAGEYTLRVEASEDGNYAGSAERKWTISRIAYPVPVAAGGTYVYTGSEQTFLLNGVVEGRMTVDGDKGTDADSYDVIVSLTDEFNCEWSDSTRDPKTIRFEIARKALSDSTISIGNKVFNGSSQSPTVTVDGGNAKIGSDYVIGGTNSGTNVYEYTLTISAEEDGNYSGTIERKWSITALRLDYPVGDDTAFTYNGSDQTYVLEGFDSRWMAKSGDVMKNAGYHEVTVSIIDKENCEWSDGRVDARTYEFNIGKKALTISASNIDVPYGTATPAYSASGEGFAEGDGVSALGGTPKFSSGYKSTDDAGTIREVTVSGYESDDYTISYSPTKGVLTVIPLEITVWITGATANKTVSGSVQTAEGFTAESSSPLYDVGDITYVGAAVASGTEAGTYRMNLDAEKFRGNDPNFDIEFIIVSDGSLVISPHVHEWSSEYASDGTHHWFACNYDGCDERKDVTAHAYGEWISIGESQHMRACVCGHEEVRSHSFEYTCISEGKHRASCSCGFSFEADHTWDEGSITTPATHLAFGVRTFSCTVDGCTGTRTEQIPKTAEHSYGEWESFDGYRHKHECECGEAEYQDHALSYERASDLKHTASCSCGYHAEMDHTWDGGAVTTPATHLAFGVRTYECTADGCTATRTEQIPKIAEHSYGAWASVDAEKHKHVCACGDEVFEPHGWGEWITTLEPTEESTGTKERTCASCGHKDTATIPKTGHVHTWSPSLSHSEGYHWYACADCSERKDEATHEHSLRQLNDAQHKLVCICGHEILQDHSFTCSSASDEKHRASCSCGFSFEADHTWGEWCVTTQPTHATDGVRTCSCTADGCDAIKIESIAAIGHSFGGWMQFDESKHKRICSCDEVEYEDHAWGEWIGDVDGHTHSCACGESVHQDHAYGDWIVDSVAEMGQSGSKHMDCDICEHRAVEVIPAIVPSITDLEDRSVVSIDADMDGSVDIRSILETLEKAVEIEVSDKGSIIFNVDAVSQLIEGDVVLSVREVDAGSYEGARLVLEIDINGAGVTFTGNGKAKVVYEFTEPTPDGKVAKVYHIDGDEKIDMGAVFENGTVSWETDHFSTYVVEFVDAVPTGSGDSDGGSPIAWIVVGVVALLAVGGAVGFFMYRKKQA